MQKFNKKKYVKTIRRQRKAFGMSPSGSRANPAYSKNLKRERRGFHSGITRGRPNAMTSNRHTQTVGRQKKFSFLFPGKGKFYRGNRSRLGLFKSK